MHSLPKERQLSTTNILNSLVSSLSAAAQASAQSEKKGGTSKEAVDIFKSALEDALDTLSKTTSTPAAASSSTAATATADTAATEKASGNVDYYSKFTKAKLNPNYKTPDYLKQNGFVLDMNKERLNQFLNDNPQYGADFLNITNGGLSKFSTDGSSLVKTDVSALATADRQYFQKNVSELLAYESFGMDPTLAHRAYVTGERAPAGNTMTSYLQTHKWTADGPVESDNAQYYASAKPIGINGVASVLVAGQSSKSGEDTTGTA